MRAISAAGVEVDVKLVIGSAPYDHLTAGPHRRVIVSSKGRVRRAGSRPTVSAGAVSAACIKLDARAAKHPAPDDHFATSPHRRVTISRRRCIVEARGDPTVRAQVISAAGIAVVKRFVDASPDNHFTAGPHPCMPGTAERDVANACRHPTVGSGAVSAAGM